MHFWNGTASNHVLRLKKIVSGKKQVYFGCRAGFQIDFGECRSSCMQLFSLKTTCKNSQILLEETLETPSLRIFFVYVNPQIWLNKCWLFMRTEHISSNFWHPNHKVFFTIFLSGIHGAIFHKRRFKWVKHFDSPGWAKTFIPSVNMKMYYLPQN